MFWTLVQEVHADLNDLRSIITANEALRDLLFPTNISIESPAVTGVLQPIRDSSPTKPVWAEHDHCAAVTRLYSILEDFIDSIIKEYLKLLPDIFPSYHDLPPQTLTQHRIGVSQILAKLGDKGLYRYLTELDALRGITDGYTGNRYALLSEAFLIDPQNYRADRINSVFGYLGIANIWAGVEKHSGVVEYMKTRDPNDTPKTILKRLVDDRNLASHSGATSVLGVDEILSLISFTEAIVEAIAQIARKKCAVLQCSAGTRLEMFEVLHRFNNKVVGVRFLLGSVRVGDQLIVLDHVGAYRAKVLSIRHHETVLETADADTFDELGLQLDVTVAKNARLFSY
jgi:hypothetical protein